MDWTLVLLLALVASIFYIYINRNASGNLDKQLAPLLRGIPFLGYVTFLRPNRYVILEKLHKKHGPIFRIPIFNSEFLVIGSIDALRSALIDQGDVFAKRPCFRYLQQITMNRGIVCKDGEFWQIHRRFNLRALRDLGFGKTLSLNAVHEEVQTLCDYIDLHNSNPVNTKFLFSKMTNNVICSIVFGQRFEKHDSTFDELSEKIQILMEIDGNPVENFPMYFPFMIDYPMIMKIYKKFVHREKTITHIHGYIQGKLDELSSSITSEPRNLIEAMLLHRQSMESQGELDHKFDDRSIVADVFDLFIAGTDTTAASLTWAMALLSVHQEVQRKVREEVKMAIGLEKLPTMQDRPKLNYTAAVLDEISRFASIAPTSLLHKTSEDTILSGFHIPKDTLVMPNLYAVHRDPTLWKNPNQFDPNNFLDDNGVYRPSENLVSFSLGKRSCLGESLARMELFIFFVATLQRYEMSLPSSAIDMDREKILEGDDGLVRHLKYHSVVFKSIHC